MQAGQGIGIVYGCGARHDMSTTHKRRGDPRSYADLSVAAIITGGIFGRLMCTSTTKVTFSWQWPRR
jgi:hypothetical protein